MIGLLRDKLLEKFPKQSIEIQMISRPQGDFHLLIYIGDVVKPQLDVDAKNSRLLYEAVRLMIRKETKVLPRKLGVVNINAFNLEFEKKE